MNDPSGFEFIAGNLALDFVNTVGNRGNPEKRRELLATPPDLVRWCRSAELDGSGITAKQLTEAIAIRERLYAVFQPVADGKPIDRAALAAFDDDLRACEGMRRMGYEGGRVFRGWAPMATSLQQATYPILAAAAALLVSPGQTRIHECEGRGCGWLFVDNSRGKPRKWCSMRDCGNKAKARRAYRRRADS